MCNTDTTYEVGDLVIFKEIFSNDYPLSCYDISNTESIAFGEGLKTYYGTVISTTKSSTEKGHYSVDSTITTTTRKYIGPIYYINGEAIFDEDLEINKKLKKEYKKFMKENKEDLKK